MPVHFFEQEVSAKLKNKRKLSAFLQALIHAKKSDVEEVELNYIFCNDDYLLEINQQYLDHDTFTDIITFDLSDHKAMMNGEIYISTDRIADNAKKFETTYQKELHRVIFHGALHLCGYKDKTAAQKNEMRRQEDNCLKAYFNED